MPAKKGRTAGVGKPAVDLSDARPSVQTPQPSRWQLMTSSILVTLWIFFLAWMAFTG